jgi:hypothetical protein
MSKKSRRRNKKILAALALAGGAAMLAKGRGKGAVSTAGQAVGVDRITPKSNWINKKADVVSDAADVGSGGTDKFLPRVHGGTLLNQRRKIPGYGTAVAPPGILNPYNPRTHVGRGVFKGGGIAKRGTGAAYKKGGRVKSMGIAKRGGGIAKR